MKPSEYYNEYFRIKTKDGLVKPKPLSKQESIIMDLAYEMGVPPYLYMKGRGGNRLVVNPQVKENLP
jgi:hypothetical protein